MKTDKFYAVLGLPEAYRHETNPVITQTVIGEMWKRWATVVGARSDCFVGAVVTESVVAFDVLPFVENVILITGERNPAVTKAPATYRQAVIDILKLMGGELGIVTAKLTFRVVDSEWIDLTSATAVPDSNSEPEA